MYTTILIAFLCYTDGGKSYILKDIANYYFLLKVSLIFFFRPSLIFCIHVFLVSCVWISRMNFSPHMPSLYISESFWISSVWFFLLSLNVCLCSMILDFISYKLGIKKTMHGEILCRLGSIPIIMSTNHVKFVVFLPVVKLAFFSVIFFPRYIFDVYYTHTLP